MIHKQEAESPDGGEYLLVLAKEMDYHGNWIATEVQSFQTLEQLKCGLMGIMTDSERIVIRAAGHFGSLVEDLGLQLITAEWGRI